MLNKQFDCNPEFIELFTKIETNPMEYNYRKVLKTLNYEEMKYLAEIIIEEKIGESKNAFALIDIPEQYDQYKFIIELTRNRSDNRLMLWVPLPIEDKIKMFINQRDNHESQLMQMLM